VAAEFSVDPGPVEGTVRRADGADRGPVRAGGAAAAGPVGCQKSACPV